jgi:hypothetical protein
MTYYRTRTVLLWTGVGLLLTGGWLALGLGGALISLGLIFLVAAASR